jgi:hypothetical protein
VNLAPSFNAVSNVTLNEDGPDTVIPLTGLTAGSAQENLTQTLALDAGSTDAGVLSNLRIERDGGLADGGTSWVKFSLVPNANGVATVTVSASDDGAPPASFSRNFQVTVNAVNDAPVANAVGAQSVHSGATLTIPVTGIGPGGGSDEAAQVVSTSVVADQPSLFTSLTISAVDAGTATVTAIAGGTEGNAQITVTLNDGQSANNTRMVQFPLSVTVDAPTLSNLSVGSPVQGCVAVNYTAAQSAGLPVTVTPEVDIGLGYVPLVTSGAPNLSTVSTSAAGVAHTFTWRSTANAPVPATNVKLKLTAARGAAVGTPVEITIPSITNTVSFSRADYQGGPGTHHAELADVNNDGYVDAITADAYGNSISVLLGGDGGTLRSPIAFAGFNKTCGGNLPKVFSVDVFEMNNDGFLDAVMVLQNCNEITLLHGQSDAGFGNPQQYAVGNVPLFGVPGDFDRDGYLDYAVSNFDIGQPEVSVLLNNRDGGFKPKVAYFVGSEPNKIKAADFDNDSKLDLVTADYTGHSISILFGNGDGTFQTKKSFDAGVYPRNLAVGDFTGDGVPDVLTCNPGQADDQSLVSFIFSNGVASYDPPVIYDQGDAGIHPRSAESMDVNGDGQLDVVVANLNSGNLSIYLNLGGGQFAPPVFIPVGNGPRSVLTRDLDKNGSADIVTGNDFSQNVSVLLNTSLVCGP